MDPITFFSRYWYAIIGSVLGVAFIAYHYRRSLRGAASETIRGDHPESASPKLLGMLLFIVAAAAFIWNPRYGYRIMGLACIGFGLWASIKRRIPYGIEGGPPMGYLTGILAVVVGVAMVGFGLLLLLNPAVIDEHLTFNAER